MKKFLASLIAFAALALVSTPALNAQAEGKGKGKGQMSPEQQIERLEQAVGTLTADQKTKITAIFKKTAEKMQAMSPEDRQSWMPKGRELMTAQRTEVRAVLTPDQQKKYDEMPQRGGGKKKN
jgi:Spy/CpxP family protein refolding chaperone